MAKVLVVESDSVFAAVLADRLHVAGHETLRLSDGARAASMARDEHVDLVVLGEFPTAGVAMVEALRREPATRSVPLLMLSELSSAADRVAALKAGADDYLARPCDLEELLLRLDRLLAHRVAALQVLQGDLVNHPLWALLQYLAQVRKSGVLRVRAPAGSGRVELRDGGPAEARWQGLRGREALLALLSLDEGTFHFDPAALEDASLSAPAPLPLQELLLESAWLKDESAKRRHLIPATGQPLQAATPNLPPLDGDFAGLPLQRVFERVLAQPGIRLFDLIGDEAEAPVSTRLAVGLLVETGAVAPRLEAADEELQNTREISSVLLFEVAVEDLVDAAIAAGLEGSPLRYLMLVETEVWPALRRLLEEGPGFRRNEGLRRLVEQTELRRTGSVLFPSRRGSLSLHVQVLGGPVPPQVYAVVPECAGVFVWVRGGDSLETVRAVVQRLEIDGPQGSTGVLVAGAETAGQQTALLAKGSARWRTSRHEPQSLLGVLRLLYPPDA